MGLSIGGLGDWFKKRLDDTQGVYHQVNPFDGGRTFDTNSRGAAPYVPPATVRHRNVLQKGFDQVNILDNGRSWETALPNQSQPFKSNLEELAPIGKAIVRAPAQMLNTVATQIPQAFYTAQGQFAGWENSAATNAYRDAVNSRDPMRIAQAKLRMNNAVNRVQDINRNIDAANSMFDQNKGGLFNVGTFYNADDARRGDLATGVKKIGGGTLQTAATVVPFAKGGSFILGSAPITKAALLRLGLEGAGYGSSYSAGNQLQEKGSIDPAILARDTAMGVAGNVILPVAGRGIKNGSGVVIRQGAEMLDNRAPLNEIGAIGKNVNQGVKVSAKPKPTAGLAQVTGDEISKEAEARTLMEFINSPFSNAKDMAKAKARLQELAGTATPSNAPMSVVPNKPTKGVTVGTPPPASAAPLQVTTAQPNQKLSRYANKTVQKSDEVSNPLKVLVKDEKVMYNATTDAERFAFADDFLKGKSNSKAFTEVMNQLDSVPLHSNGQENINAIQLIKRLDASGKEDDLFKATEIFHKLSADASARGQQTQALAALSARTPQGLYYQAEKTLNTALKDKGGVTKAIQQELKGLVDEVKKTKRGSYEDGLARFRVMDFVERNTPAGLADKGVQIWKAGLLSAPTTTGGNLMANTFEGVYRKLYQDPMASAADMLMSLVTGKRTKSYTARGLFEGGKEGVGMGVKYFKTGYDPRNPLQKFDVHAIHFSDTPLGKAAEKYTQGIFKLMGGQDQPFYYAAMRNSLADQAVTAAKNAGLKGDARNAFIKKFITEPSKDALQLADDEARYAVFQNKTAIGNVASKVNKGPVGQFLIPFSQVPSSIATRMIERSPLGLGKEIINQIRAGKFDQRAMSRAAADTTAGFAMIGAGAQLYNAGLITTSYPTDQKERDLWDLEGKQPNSIKVGDKWISLNYMQPMGSLFAAGANYSKARTDGKDPGAAYSSALAGASKAFTEQSFLKGVSGGLQALADPQRAAEKFAENTAGSVVPNFIRSAARSSDPSNREQDGMGESVIAGIPGLRQTLPEKTDIFGDVIPRKTGAVSSFINPLRPSDVRPSTDLNSELRRLQDADEGVTATKIIKDALGEGTELNRDQQLELKNLVGQQLKTAWTETIKDGRYPALSDGDKRRTLEKIKDDIGAVIRGQYGQKTGIKVMDPNKLSTNQQLLAYGNGGMVDYLNGAGDQTARDNFSNSGQKYQIIGDKVYYKAPNGDVVVKPKALMEYEQADATLNLGLDRSKASGNLQNWMTLAQQKLENLERKKQFYDPTFESDEIAKITLQQENLMEQVEKYKEYGGFTKGRNGGRGTNLPNIGVTISSDLFNPVVTKSSYRAPVVALKNKGTPSVRVGRSKVTIKAPKRLA